MEYIGITIFLLYIWAFFIEPELLSVKHYKVSGLNGKKIVFISDFHVGKFEETRLKRIVKKVNATRYPVVFRLHCKGMNRMYPCCRL